MKRTDKNDLFQASQLTILISYTVFSVILIAETILMHWETWPIVPIVFSLLASWTLHIQQTFTDRHRIWIYTAFIMFTFFFYGSHATSVFDTVAVMSVVMILYTMAGIKPLITFLQLLYYVTFGYGLMILYNSGEVFDSLLISRAVLHFSAVTAISIISRTTIDKWIQVLGSSHEEIDKLTDATTRLNDFLANVSHETRTPINAIIGLTGICIDEEKNDDRRANLISVREAGRRVAEQISDILDFTEIDRKKLTCNYEDYMLASVLNDLVEEIRPFKPKELELVIDVDPAIPSVMNTDIGKLRKILRHLIMNGLKYTKEGGVYVRLYSIKESYGVNLVIKVTDTGIGMTQEEQERVFERYYQADSGRTRQGGGLGLGLTIVSGFTAALGGFLTVSSRPGEGTSVSVSLPQKVVEPASCMSVAKPDQLCLGAFLHLDKYPDPNVREYYNTMIRNIVKGFGVQMHRVDHVSNLKKLLNSVRLTHLFIAEEEYETAPELMESLSDKMIVVVIANQDFTLPPHSKARIMVKPFYCFPVAAVLNEGLAPQNDDEEVYCPGVEALTVDDEPMNLIVAKNILRRYGMNVTTVGSGADAVAICRERRFDIIFMDHMMPGMDGIETMKRIRAGNTKGRGDLPIVALTANAVSTARETFLSVGFDGFVSKPIELVELERVLRRVLPKSVMAPRPTEPESAAPSANPPAAAKICAPAPKTKLEQLADCGLDTEEAMNYCGGDEEFYYTLLTQLVSESEQKHSNLDRFLAERDFRNYEILIHALKTTLKMAGSDALSARAKALELAAKEHNETQILDEHGGMMQDYLALIGRIAEICGVQLPAGETAQADEIMEFAPDNTDPDEEIMEFMPEEEGD